MGFVVAFIDHPEAELVSKIKYARMRRIVAGADRIDPCSLHHDHVGSRVRLVEHPAPDRVGFMPVHTAEDHLPPVDAEDVTINLNPPET